MNWGAFWFTTLVIPATVFTFIGVRIMLDWIEEQFGLGWSATAALFILSAMIGMVVATFPAWSSP